MRKYSGVARLGAFALFALTACSGGSSNSPNLEDSEQAAELRAPSHGHFFSATLVRGEKQIRDFQIDEQSVYYVSAAVEDPNQPRVTIGRVAQVSKHGGWPRVLVAQQKGGGSIAVNSRSVFWTGAADITDGTEAAIFTQAKRGGRITRFAPGWQGFIPGVFPGNRPEDPPYLLADDQQVYALGDLEILARIPIFSQSVVSLLQGADHVAIAMNRKEVFLSEGRNCSSFIAEIQKTSGPVSQLPPGPTSAFISDESFVCVVWSMAISGSTLYWATLEDGLIAAHLNGAPAPPDAPRVLVPPDLTDDLAPREIAVLPPNVYFTTGDGKLKSVPEAGGAATVVVDSGVDPNVRISADADSIYWVTSGDDQIRRTRVR